MSKGVVIEDKEYKLPNSYAIIIPKKGKKDFNLKKNLLPPEYIVNEDTGIVRMINPNAMGEIYYTTDGTVPSIENGTKYTSSLKLDFGEVVNFKNIVIFGENVSDVVNKRATRKDFLRFVAVDNNVEVGMVNLGRDTLSKTIQYSVDDGISWNSFSTTKENNYFCILRKNNIVLLKGNNTTYANNIQAYNKFITKGGYFKVDGDLMSIFNFRKSLYSWSCYFLFGNLDKLISAPKLSATSLNSQCYYSMFEGCTSLTQAPKLPALNMSERCYVYMFSGCTSLIQAPELPSTNLAFSCYYGMFSGCTSLIEIPNLPATNLKTSCYYSMFSGCTSLTRILNLSVVNNLAASCYRSMFSGCTSLIQAPELPATTLANGCYDSMFSGCTSLEIAPELPAIELAPTCYASMFRGCTSLVGIPNLPATILADDCYAYMFENCESLNCAIILPGEVLARRCYMNMFAGCSNLIQAPRLLATTLVGSCYTSMFAGCKNLSSIVCLAENNISTSNLSSWCVGVSDEGIFYKKQDITFPRGNSGIPSNWTVQDYVEE